MNNIFYNSINLIRNNFFITNQIPVLSKLQQKVLLIATGVLASLALIYSIKYFFAKEIKEKQDDDAKIVSPKTIPHTIFGDLNEKKSRQEILENIQQQLDSAPKIFPLMETPKKIARTLYHQEVEKLQSFLIEKVANPVQMDVAYICIGHGSVEEQVWPGFVFDALQTGKKVEVYLFESGWKYSDPTSEHLLQEYKHYLKTNPDEKAIQKLSSLSIQQFLCGFPRPDLRDDFFEESMSQQGKDTYPFMGNIFWKSRQQAIDASKNFNQYIEKILSEGRKVVLGDHRGHIDTNDALVVIYNQMVKKYSGQIYFLWGWHQCNLMTQQPLEQNDLNPEKHSFPWIYHEHLSLTQLN